MLPRLLPLHPHQDKIDPYIKVSIPGCEGEQKTEPKNNTGKPVYNQRFVFLLPPGCEADHVKLELMESDTGLDSLKASGKVPFPDGGCSAHSRTSR